MARDGYCQADDVSNSLGELPLPPYLSADRFVADAADEMDSYMGFRYEVPILSDPNIAAPVFLLLKRINVSLATGRLILAMAAPGEQNRQQAYGQSLVTQALAALALIRDGNQPMPGVPDSPNLPDGTDSQMPIMANVDGESQVEAFYNRIGNPNYAYLDYTGRNSNGLVL